MPTRISYDVPPRLWSVLEEMRTGPRAGRTVVDFEPGMVSLDPSVVMRKSHEDPWSFKARQLNAVGGQGIPDAWLVTVARTGDGTASVSSRKSRVALGVLLFICVVLVLVLIGLVAQLVFPDGGGSLGYYAGWTGVAVLEVLVLALFGWLLVREVRGRARSERRIADLVMSRIVARAESPPT